MNISGYNDSDITARKHKGNPNSVAAYESGKAAHGEECMRVLRLLSVSRSGLTSKDVAKGLDKELNAVSGRLSELKEAGYAKEGIERRDRCGVIHITEDGKEALAAHAQRRMW